MVQFDGIGTTSTEGVPGIERVDELKVLHEAADVGRGVFEVVPFAFPHFHYSVPEDLKLVEFLLRGLIHVLHGSIIVTHMFFVAVGITGGTSMGETTLKFVHGVCSDIETIHMEVGAGDAILCRHCAHVARIGEDWDDLDRLQPWHRVVRGRRESGSPRPAAAFDDRTRLTIRRRHLIGSCDSAILGRVHNRLNVKQPCFKRRTSDSQYSINSFWKSNRTFWAICS